jgi:AraC-like DNA-binding protein
MDYSFFKYTGIVIKIADTEINAVVDANLFTPNRSSTDIHEHPYFEVQICTGGEYVVETGKNNSLNMKKGAVCIVPPMCYHKTSYFTPDAERYSFKFMFKGKTDSVIEKGFKKTTEPVIVGHAEDFVSIIKKLDEEMNSQKIACDDMIEALIKEFYITLIRIVCNDMTPISEIKGNLALAKNDTESARSGKLELYFDKNYMNDVTAADLAEALGLSVRQLNRILNKTYQMSFREKLIDLRLHKAESKLLSTDTSVERISYEVGYLSPSGFSFAFKKKYGMTPADYRRVYKK